LSKANIFHDTLRNNFENREYYSCKVQVSSIGLDYYQKSGIFITTINQR
jgi:hypothetical protein